MDPHQNSSRNNLGDLVDTQVIIYWLLAVEEKRKQNWEILNAEAARLNVRMSHSLGEWLKNFYENLDRTAALINTKEEMKEETKIQFGIFI